MIYRVIQVNDSTVERSMKGGYRDKVICSK